MKRFQIGKYLYQGLIALVLIFVISTALDWLRAPTFPDDFMQHPFTTIEGDTVTFNQLSQDKPLLVYIWASWCSICRLTTPSVGNLSADEYNVISIALRSGDEASIRTYLGKKQIRLPVINDDRGELSRAWDIAATPTFIFIHKGKVSYSMTGWTSEWSLKLRLALISLMDSI